MSESLAPQAPTKPIRDFSRLSRTEESLILQLHAEGKTQVAIAQVLGCSQPTVSAVLKAYSNTKFLAKRLLDNSAATLAERVVKHANVAESLDVLERIEVIAPKKQDTGRSGQVTVVIGMPGQPAGPEPIITIETSLSPETFNELPVISTG